MESCCGLVLAREPAGEHFLKLTWVSAEHGLQMALMRNPSKPGAMVPDLFDTAEFSLEMTKGVGAQFVREYRVLHREAALGGDYARFMAACRFAIVIAKNSMPAESAAGVYTLCQETLAAFARRPRPDATLFKALWRLAREEGFAVREHWLSRLTVAEQGSVAATLVQALDVQKTPVDAVEHLTRSLEQWLAGECHFVIAAI